MLLRAPVLSTLVCTAIAALASHSAVAATVDPADANLVYTGRWDDSNPSEPWAKALGSSVIARFEGTSIAATLTTGSEEHFRVIIDDDAANSSRLTLASGVSTTLASGLADTIHKLELVKETDQARATLLALELDAGKSLAAPPPGPSRKIAFYGDSNLAGYSLGSERNLGGWDLIGSYYGYAGIAARMFDAEYHNFSKSGATISSLNTSFDRIDWDSNNSAWDFSEFVADVVVVNIGANDEWRPKNINKSRYHDLLDDLRAAHPAAHIVLYNAYGWDTSEPANYTHEVIDERGDANLSSVVFPWVFEQFHGCQTDHAGMAVYLAAHLVKVMGWTPGAPDVMSGYGWQGALANGSFERRAPFGGWGWRYFDDPGVSRIHDPSGAHDGAFYLRLFDGASSHQTNPAGDGDTVVVTIWMRGEFDGDQIDVTLGFRDQEDGADIASPMQADTQTFVLTSSWQSYSMLAIAPSTGTPVYSVRVTFEAAAGDRVEIDAVTMGDGEEIPLPIWLPAVLGASLAGLGVWRSARVSPPHT